MSWSNIVFSEDEKLKLQEMASILERELESESRNSKELAKFAQYSPLVEAIKLAKEKKINTPIELPNMNYWYFESPVAEWFHFSTSRARNVLSDFMRTVSGFPCEEMKNGDLQNDA